jgi:hypothetical protein
MAVVGGDRKNEHVDDRIGTTRIRQLLRPCSPDDSVPEGSAGEKVRLAHQQLCEILDSKKPMKNER